MSAGKYPSPQARWLGRQLRELREGAGKTLQDAASYLQRNQSTVSRFESAEYPIRRPDVLALLELYGITDATRREALLRLSEDVWEEGWWEREDWWEDFGDVIEGRTLLDYTWLESRAQAIFLFGVMLVPGLLQGAAYATEVIDRWDPHVLP
jgi:transcriptional regulator with XRE-family HTH domain